MLLLIPSVIHHKGVLSLCYMPGTVWGAGTPRRKMVGGPAPTTPKTVPEMGRTKMKPFKCYLTASMNSIGKTVCATINQVYICGKVGKKHSKFFLRKNFPISPLLSPSSCSQSSLLLTFYFAADPCSDRPPTHLVKQMNPNSQRDARSIWLGLYLDHL